MKGIGPTEPPVDEAKKCIRILERLRQGEFVSSNEQVFRLRIFQKYPAWYSKTQKEMK